MLSVSVNLLVYQSACLPACMYVCGSVYLPVYSSVCLPVGVLVCWCVGGWRVSGWCDFVAVIALVTAMMVVTALVVVISSV